GMPMRVISCRPAPLPPSRSRILAPPWALPSPKLKMFCFLFGMIWRPLRRVASSAALIRAGFRGSKNREKRCRFDLAIHVKLDEAQKRRANLLDGRARQRNARQLLLRLQRAQHFDRSGAERQNLWARPGAGRAQNAAVFRTEMPARARVVEN